MANKISMALATIALALASGQTMDTEVIKTLAGQCGIDETTAHSIADELIMAKSVAESDMENA